MSKTKSKKEAETSMELESNASKQDPLVTKFNQLTSSLITAYEKYSKFGKYSDMDDMFKMENLIEHRSELLDKFKHVFYDLCNHTKDIKRDNYNTFESIFQKSNIVIIQLYQFINKLLNIYDDDSSSFSETLSQQQLGDVSLEHQPIIIEIVLEFLVVLTTSNFIINSTCRCFFI